MPRFDDLDLVPLADPAHVAATHALRRIELFERYEPGTRYTPALIGDDSRAGNLGHVLLRRGEVIGTIRIDLIDRARAGFRLVTVKGDLKSQGIGGWMLARAEAIVRAYARTSIVVNASLPAAAFYRRHGFTEGEWPDVRDYDPATQVRLGKRVG